ncbi:peptide-methionine (S)-S-oxide reductase MsrA [Prochlorococcus marinus]|uniref:peptide-methionine (S)-S-oxide reductase MsrA n=1 Tax=Prochlorococcus marinus TaxID=1219 RepID=UPI0022B43410|nr:peptide-methionine (S)-S-oxide reductase MsrA [Prochlorococcus marinus]
MNLFRLNKFQLIPFILSLLIIYLCLFLFPNYASATTESGVFAGGCFWCLEHDFEDIKGILSVDSGYTGGKSTSPTYKNHKGHQEAIQVKYNSTILGFEDLLKIYWRNIDPYDDRGQFCDRGDSYRPVIYFSSIKQKDIAKETFQNVSDELSVPIDKLKVKLQKLEKFYIAEDYHQNFAKRNKLKYSFYRNACGRDQKLDEVWGSNSRKGVDWEN